MRRWRPSAWRSRRRRARRRGATGSWSACGCCTSGTASPTAIWAGRSASCGTSTAIGVTDVIVSEPATASGGRVWVYSGRTGALLHRLDGAPGDFFGGAIADAGDTDRDGVHDIVGRRAEQPHDRVRPRPRLPLLRAHRPAACTGGRRPGRTTRSAPPSPARATRTATGTTTCSSARWATISPAWTPARRSSSPAARTACCAGSTAATRAAASARPPTATASLGGDRPPELIVGAWNEGPGDAAGGGGVHVLGRAGERFALAPPAGAAQFGNFFVAGVGRVDGDRIPDLYAADYAASGGNGFAGVYSGRDGSPIHAWPGGPRRRDRPRPRGRRRRPRRPRRPRRRRPTRPARRRRAASTSARARRAGSCARSRRPRPGEQLGFDAVGVGDTNRDGRPDLLLSAAEGDAVYLVAGERRRGPRLTRR